MIVLQLRTVQMVLSLHESFVPMVATSSGFLNVLLSITNLFYRSGKFIIVFDIKTLPNHKYAVMKSNTVSTVVAEWRLLAPCETDTCTRKWHTGWNEGLPRCDDGSRYDGYPNLYIESHILPVCPRQMLSTSTPTTYPPCCSRETFGERFSHAHVTTVLEEKVLQKDKVQTLILVEMRSASVWWWLVF